MARRSMSAEEVQAYRAERLAQLEGHIERGVEQLVTGEQWLQAVAFAGRFRSRSWLNSLAIAIQHADAHAEGRVPNPSPTYVAGYSEWQKLGRWPAAGQTGYIVRSPVFERWASANPSSGEWRRLRFREKPRPGEMVRRRMAGTKPGTVWDVSQTEGAPIPARPEPQLLRGEAPAGLWDGVTGQIRAAGYELVDVPAAKLGTAKGMTRFSSKLVLIRSDMDDAARARTAVHELGHVLMHDPRHMDHAARLGVIEVEAESLAAMVCASYGMDPDGYTIPYVAGWASSVEGMEPGEVIRQVGERVRAVACGVLEQLDAPVSGDGKPPAPEKPSPANTLSTDSPMVTAVGVGAEPEPATEREAVTI